MADKHTHDPGQAPDIQFEANAPAPPPASGAGKPGYGGYGQAGYAGYSGYAGYASSEPGEIHLLDYVRTIYRHRWLALSIFAVTLVSVIVYTFSTTPIYEGRVQVQIEPENPNIVSFKEVVELDKATNEYYQTQYSILRSRALAKRTIDAAKLWDYDELGGAPSTRTSWWSSWFGSDEKKASAPAAGETGRQSAVIDEYLQHVTIAPIRNSRLVDIRFRSRDPRLAAGVTNTIAQQYIQQNLEFKFLSTKQASDWLGQQLTEQRKKVEESELALQKYREKGDAVALEDRQNIVVQRLSDLNAAVTKARTERIEKEALYRQLETIQGNQAALDTFPAILSNTFIQGQKSKLAELQSQQAQMSDRLGEKHPDMVKLASAIQAARASLQTEITKVVMSVRNEYLAAQSQERALSASLESQKTEALGLNRTGIQYGVLAREAESNRQIYQSLLQRTKETSISGELKTSNIRVVDEAEVPQRPIKPKPLTNLLLGLFGGLVAALGLAFFAEYVDNRIKNPDELKRLGFAFLGMVPAIQRAPDAGPPLIGKGMPQDFNESFRGIRTNVAFSAVHEGAMAILVTSSQPGEGKTAVASNLAMAIAHTGQRVLLVDADMRKPRQHDVFHLKQAPGLSSVLAGMAKVGDAVHKSSAANLWVLPAGPCPPNPAELLASERFSRLLDALLKNFDVVIVDSPPILAVTDAAVVAHRMTGVVFVVGSEQVSRPMVMRAAEQLESARATILGCVLNRVNVVRNPYYYSHYYRSDYANYYNDAPKG
jgi:capsular exopolysaccharide synthesis family protein